MQDKLKTSRKDYLKHGEGIARSLAVGALAQSMLANKYPLQQDDIAERGSEFLASEICVLPEGMQGLCLVTTQGKNRIKYLEGEVEFLATLMQFTDEASESKVEPAFLFNDGLGDQGFTWHFTPWLAARCVYAFSHQGIVPTNAPEAVSLSDIANMMRQEWFHDLVHDMALAGPALYRTVGEHPGNFAPDFGMTSVFGERGEEYQYRDHFYPDALVTEIDEHGQPRARLDKEFRESIRKTMHQAEEGSIGCPVAHKVFLVEGEARQSSYIGRLLEAGRIEAIGKNRYRQTTQLISETVDRVAEYFEEYGKTFGQPYIDKGTLQVAHKPLNTS